MWKGIKTIHTACLGKCASRSDYKVLFLSLFLLTKVMMLLHAEGAVVLETLMHCRVLI